MSELKKIVAPELSSEYGRNIVETFDNIQQNFDVLANQELYRGEAGTNLITVNLPWETVFDTTAGTIPVSVGSVEPKTYYILNFGPAIRSVLSDLSQGDEVDTTAAIDGLKNSGSITVCFADVETTIDTPTQVLSVIPFVFIDMRFRNVVDYPELDNHTDMSCVIMYTNGWKCVQSFPTLYYNGGNLYWKINGQNTSILAQGPAGKDGSTGTVYVGLSNGLNINTVLVSSGSTPVDITYLLQYQIISPESPDFGTLTDDSKSHLPFVTIADWININKSKPINGAPVIIMGESSSSVDDLGVPYYISELIYSESGNTCTSNVSKYNICYAHMNDRTVKEALQKNVLFRGDPEGDNELKGVSIKERGAGVAGYSIFVPVNTTVTSLKEFTFAYVDDIDDPKVNYTDQSNTNTYKGRFRFVGGMTVGTAAPGISDQNLVAAGGSIAHGCINTSTDKIEAGTGSYAGGFAIDGSEITASGSGAHAEGFARGFSINGGEITASGNGAHAEGCVNGGQITASGSGAHAEGFAINGTKITASGSGAHAEGGNTTARGDFSHAEGAGTTASGGTSHAEGTGTTASGGTSHAEGASTTAGGNCSHAEGYKTVAGVGDRPTPSSIPTTGYYSHAEGNGTQASGNSAHAEGNHTLASGKCSHAEGNNTTAIGIDAHAEGNSTTAKGDYSHAEGANTTAIGIDAHAEGVGTMAAGNYSHAEGLGTIAIVEGSHACGTYNAPGWILHNPGSEVGSNYYVLSDVYIAGAEAIIFSVGCGKTSETFGPSHHRRNAFIVTSASTGELPHCYVLGTNNEWAYYNESGLTHTNCDQYKKII